MALVEMYSTQTCSSCIRAKRLLAAKDVTVVEIDVTEDRSIVIERSGMMTVPQIFIDGRHIGGYEALVALDHAGELDPLLHS